MEKRPNVKKKILVFFRSFRQIPSPEREAFGAFGAIPL